MSSILYLFFNADLVQQQINGAGGSVAFIDDYTAWVTGPSAQANREGIQAIIDRALNWERRSGATFEAEKTAIIHFSRTAARVDRSPFTIKGETVVPKDEVKVLGVLMDTRLQYKQHIARAATKGLEAAMQLKRLSGLSPSAARHLFIANVAPAMDYASSVWMHGCVDRTIKAIHRVQNLGAQAIVGTFCTVATAVAEAEAGILSAQERFAQKATKLWVGLRTLPDSNPLRRLGRTATWKFKRFISPLQRMAGAHQGIALDRMETVHSFATNPWEQRIPMQHDIDKAVEVANAGWAVRIATSSSARNGVVGIGGAVALPASVKGGNCTNTFSNTLSGRAEQNAFTAELAAVEGALKLLPAGLTYRVILIMTCNKAAALALSKPRRQSGQEVIRRIYHMVSKLRNNGNRVSIAWIPSNKRAHPAQAAKEAARGSTKEGSIPSRRAFRAWSTTLNLAKQKMQSQNKLPENIGKFSKRVDAALPGKHTRTLYDSFNWKEARILAQLRTGMLRLNGYLHQVGAAPSAQCACGYAKETVEHFLFRCTKWTALRTQMLQCTDTRRGNLSYFLGGKAKSDAEDWTPDLDAVRATVKYAIATGRLYEE